MAPGSTMLVCELMEGGSVHDRLRTRQLTWAEGCGSLPFTVLSAMHLYPLLSSLATLG